MDQHWIIRIPNVGATGLEFARGRLAATHHVLTHALPEIVDVEVRTEDGRIVARGTGLADEPKTPMDRLTIEGDAVLRANDWPSDADLGSPVLLCGGEVGILTSWWNADDGSSWRWSLELSNSR